MKKYNEKTTKKGVQKLLRIDLKRGKAINFFFHEYEANTMDIQYEIK